MESSYNECPTEVLIDLKEDDFVPCYKNSKEDCTLLHSQKAIKCMESKEKDLFEFEIKQEKYQCIMDMSPFRLRNECSEPAINSFANSEQVLDGTVNDCPTGVLIDVPSSSRRSPKKHFLLNCNKSDSQQEALLKYKSSSDVIGVQEYNYCRQKKYSAVEDSDNPYSYIPMKNELSPPRLRWKSPSPQSMSRISKEASKIIHTLNSSAILDEDDLLCEEILPIPINFDLDENSDQETLEPETENSSTDGLSNYTSSVSIQTGQELINTELSKMVLDSPRSVIENTCNSSKHQNSYAQSSSEPVDSNINLKSREDSSKCSISSEELQSPEIQGGSLDNLEVFKSNEKPNLLIQKNLLSEDKENIQERKDEKVLPSKTVVRGKAAQKNALSIKEMENRPKLKNLSNINNNTNSRYLPSTKKISTSHLSYNSVSNSEDLQFRGKHQLKKTISADPQRTPKAISHSKSFQHDSTKESILSFQQPHPVKQKPSLLSGYKSSSSDVKNSHTQMKTPSKRYSIAAPSQNASTKKSTLTPTLSRIQNPSIPRFTPQSAQLYRGSRLSFSKSWQQPSNSNSKGFKNLNPYSIPTSSVVEKPSFCGTYSCKLNKQALNQSISSLSSQTSKNSSLSTTSKKRFCSKLNLPSPLLAGQDRKLARALFPSFPPK